MRKSLIPLLFVSILAITGCGNNASKPDEFIVDDNTKLTSQTWDNKVDKMIQYTCGDAASLFPHLQGTSYYTYIETIDGTKCTVMNVYVNSLSEVIDNYELTLTNKEFVVSGDAYYAYHIFEETDDAVVQYSEMQDKKGKFFVELIFYTATTRYLEFQMDLVQTVLGTSIPVPEASSYSAYFDPYSMMGYIYANNVTLDAFTKYHQALIATGKFILTQDTAYGNTYSSSDGYLYIDLSPSYDEYGRDSLLIRFMNNWPRVEILSYLGGLDIPKYSDVYTDGCLETQYLDTDGDGVEDVFEIIFDNVSSEQFTNYTSKYKSYGWTLEEDSTSKNCWFTQTVGEGEEMATYLVGVLLGRFPGYFYDSIVVVIYL